jgi:glycine cleavage system H protein
MEVHGYSVPDDLLYTGEHEWAKVEGNRVRIGVTDYASKTLNDVVYVTLPKVGDKVTQLKPVGTVESIKAVSELYAPLSGTVAEVNVELTTHPELVNKSPYSEGWLFELVPSDFDSERSKILDAKAYSAHLASLLK